MPHLSPWRRAPQRAVLIVSAIALCVLPVQNLQAGGPFSETQFTPDWRIAAPFSIERDSAGEEPEDAAGQQRAEASPSTGAAGSAGASAGGIGAGTVAAIAGGVAVVGGAVALGASGGGGGDDGGGGGSSGGSSVITDPATPAAVNAFRTSEYLAHGGYDRVNLAHAYARGYTGAGHTIAILDDGYQLNHPEFAGKIQVQFNAAGNPLPGAMPIETHGTHVTGIAAARKDNVGMHGAAFDANLALYQFGTLDQSAAQFTRAGILGATVISNSWGYNARISDVQAEIAGGKSTASALASVVGGTASDWQNFLNAMDGAQDAGSVIVFAASNNPALGGIDVSSGMPLVDSRLMGQWLAVTNVNSSDQVVSVGCGQAQAFCLAAPGTNIYSTVPTSTYGNLSGTSMATPLVSGAVVLVVEGLGLSPEEAVSRLLTTADRSFAGYSANAHGQGILDLDAATSPIGRVQVLTSGNVHDGGTGPGIMQTVLSASRAFGDAFTKALDGLRIAAFDEGGAAFLYNLGDRVAVQEPVTTALDTLQSLGTRTDLTQTALPGGGGVSIAVRDADLDFRSTQLGTGVEIDAAFLDSPLWGGTFSAGFHQSSGEFLNRLAPEAAQTAFAYRPEMFSVPYAGFAEDGYSAGLEMPLGDKASIGVLSFEGEGNEDRAFDGFGALTTLSLRPTDRIAIGIDGGAMSEDGTVLGTDARGGLGLGEDSRTAFAGIRAEAAIDEHWTLLGSYHHGWTVVGGSASALITSVGNVKTQQMSGGLIGEHLFSKGDALGLAVSQPLRITGGQTSLNLPVWRDWNGDILTRHQDVSLRPSGQETRYEMTYGFDIDPSTRLTGLTFHRSDADHIAGRQETAAVLRLQHRF